VVNEGYGAPVEAGGSPFDEFERAGWEERAPAYGDFFADITGRAIEPLLDAAGVRAGCRVLDVGSGPGYAAAACAARGASAVGVDVAAQMVARARERLPGIDFHRADAHDLPFPDGSFDALVANFVILHLGRPDDAVREFARVVAPGGRLALSTWDSPDRARFIGVFVEAIAAAGAQPPPDLPPGPPFFRFADPAQFTGVLAAAGLVEVDVETVAFGLRLASPEALWDGILGSTVRFRALLLGQPEPVLARVRAEYGRLVLPYVDARGAVEIPVSVRIARARRPA
jgi:SAM-dependent methyltransferase